MEDKLDIIWPDRTPSDLVKKRFGIALKALRTSRGLSERQLSILVGVSRQSTTQYEKGVCSPKMDIVFKISKALGVEVSFLFDHTLAINELINKHNETKGQLEVQKSKFLRKINATQKAIDNIDHMIVSIEKLKRV